MTTSTAIVVGGGVIGLSTAYHLARKKFGRTILLEKGWVGDGSSSRAAGIITGLMWNQTAIRARKRSLELFAELSQELEGYSFRNVGCLNLHDRASWVERRQLLPVYEELGVPFEILDDSEIRRRWPALTPDEDWLGLFDPAGGYSEPDEYIPALAKKIQELGVEVRQHEPLLEFKLRNGCVTGVRTASGDIEGDAVVCTVHSWTLVVVAHLGLRLPFKSFVHQRYLSEPLTTKIWIPAVNANPLGGYVRPACGGRLLVGIETPERDEYRVTSSDFHMSSLTAPSELRDKITRQFGDFVPFSRTTSWESEKIGLIAFSMDREPILGSLAQLPGLYVGLGFHSGGFAYNPVAGLLLAELVVSGRTSIDVSLFSPDRFNLEESDRYLATTITQGQVARRRH